MQHLVYTPDFDANTVAAVLLVFIAASFECHSWAKCVQNSVIVTSIYYRSDQNLDITVSLFGRHNVLNIKQSLVRHVLSHKEVKKIETKGIWASSQMAPYSLCSAHIILCTI